MGFFGCLTKFVRCGGLLVDCTGNNSSVLSLFNEKEIAYGGEERGILGVSCKAMAVKNTIMKKVLKQFCGMIFGNICLK